MPTSLAGLTLHVQDLARSVEFYSRIPGAEMLVHRPGMFAMFRMGAGRLGLLQANLPRPFHVELEVPDLDAMYQELKQAGVEPESPPTDRPWGERDFHVIDPDGNILEFDSADAPNANAQPRTWPGQPNT